tara:strand:+ start:2814 stop:3389 length:576 start_codon:yes stop_codon:yes gene_type:complete
MTHNEYIREIKLNLTNDDRTKLVDYATGMNYHEAVRSKYSGIFYSTEVDSNHKTVKSIITEFLKEVPDAHNINVRFFKFFPYGTIFPHRDIGDERTNELFPDHVNDSTFLIPLYPDPVSDMYAPLMFWEDDWKKIPFDWFNGEKAAYIVPKTPNGYIVNLSKIHSIMNHTPFHRYNLQIRFTTKQKDLFNG